MTDAADIVENFAEELKRVFALPETSSPEDQLKSPVSRLLEGLGTLLGIDVATRTEAHLAEDKVRPDIAIYTSSLITGHIELKAPGNGADAPKLKGAHNKEQWAKLKNLPNLIYTDGREWALYRNGERVDSIVRFSDDPAERGGSAIDGAALRKLEALIRDFLFWKPNVPHRPRELAAFIAPLTRFLRSEVENALKLPDSNVNLLAEEWRRFFFPDADDGQFADAYAQTVTYAMLLARLQGASSMDPHAAAQTLDQNNGLLARALELLGQPGALNELKVGFELLQRSMEALEPSEFLKSKPDLWLYFYEDFLAAYDPKLRRDYGVYYTPREVVELQVRLASELLETRFGKKLGFADDGVVFLDPAVGTGTYLVATAKHALEKVRERSGEGAVPARATQMAENMYGFELLVGPYAVSHLRLTQALESEGATIPKRLKVYLADTLESPNATPPGGLTLTYKALTEEHEAARKIKKGGDILVCLGNPPYDRQHLDEGDTETRRKGGWVRYGDQLEGGARQEAQGERPIFADFTEPASAAGAGVHLKNLYNDYVYFWRWALWRLFEQQTCGGIVTFITASSYLAGPGFIGMRETMRRTFDELWIIDLGGDNLGTRKTPNVFNIQTPVAIAIGMRGQSPSPDTPAKTHYAKISSDTRSGKLTQLDALQALSELTWHDCAEEWHASLLPVGIGDYFDWPIITDIFPWQHSGAQFKRSWPIGESEEVLNRRLDKLIAEKAENRAALFKESRDRKITYKPGKDTSDKTIPSVKELADRESITSIGRYAFRSFDRQFAILDVRFGDYLRTDLLSTTSEKQIFFTTLLTDTFSEGPAVTLATHLPDLHYFSGRGGKDAIPLYRNAEATESNTTNGLLDLLSETYGFSVNAEDLAAYVYALLGGQSYTQRFWNELETPGPRVPLTKDGETFRRAAALGRRLIWLHTYAERFQGESQGNTVPTGEAKCIAPIPTDPARYPEKPRYDPVAQEIHVGEGRFGPVAPEIWAFEVSGLKVVQSWLGYRMKVRAGKKSSPLDDIRPERWTPRMTDEFLELLWVLEATLDMEPELEAALDSAVAGECFTVCELPEPTEEERKAPRTAADAGGQTQDDLFGAPEEDAD